jgi:hypothetical protein
MSDGLKVDLNDNLESVLFVLLNRNRKKLSHENLLDSFHNFRTWSAGIFGWFSMQSLAKIGHFLTELKKTLCTISRLNEAYFSERLWPKSRNYSKQNFQALRMEVKKMTYRFDSKFIELQNCSLQTPTRHLNILHLCVFFIKEVKSLTVFLRIPWSRVIRDTC